MSFDRVIYNGVVMTVNPDFDIIPDGVVGIKSGIIECAESRKRDIPYYPAKEYINARGGIILPGLVNAHVHLPMSLFRGLADDLSYWDWMNDHIFPAEKKYINAKTVRIGTLLSCAEMIMAGTTTCCDGYFFEDAAAEAVMETGLRAVLAQGVIDFPAPGVPDPLKNIEAANEFVKRWKGRSPLIIPSIFCHSPYTCSAETLINGKQAADQHGVLFQIHVAETKAEVEQMRAEKGMSPVQYLDNLNILDHHTLIHHGVWLDEKDISILSERKTGMVHCPESNMKLASGIAPVPEMIRQGIAVGLGTDGCASNNNLDLFCEMDSAAKLHKVHKKDPTVMNAKTVLRMATIEGANAIGLGDKIGSIEPGKQADIIIIDTHKPHLTPMYHPESHLVYAVCGSDVRDVFVAGKAIYRNYRFKMFDVDDILNRSAAIGHDILLTN